VISFSHNHPRLDDEQLQADFLANYPSTFFFKDIDVSTLPVSLLEKLRVLKDPEINFYWLLHIINQGSKIQHELLWKNILKRPPEDQLNELVTKLVEQMRWHDLEHLAKNIESFKLLDSVLALQSGISIRNFRDDQYSSLPVKLLTNQVKFNTQCKNTVLLVADHLEAYLRLNTLREQYQADPMPSQNSFCFSEVFYVGNALGCEEGFNGFALCDINFLLPSTDYIIAMTKSGLANVRDRQMTLALSSDIDVLIHELMHFSGFEDEYPVYAEKAKWLCSSNGMKAPNLFVGHNEYAPSGWVPARTCENGHLNAYKPSLKWSKMQYQELPLTEQYRELWRKKVYKDWFNKQQVQATSLQVIIN